MTTASVRKIWFIANVMSGRYNAGACKRLVAGLEEAGGKVTHVLRFPEEPLPDRETLEAEGVDRIAIFTGDGTVNGLMHKAEGWDGEVLVLPGGTMNLLCKAIHASEEAEAIIARAAAAPPATPLPVVRGAGQTALTGIVAGPTAAWGKVREAIRHADVASLAELVPDAWRRSLDDIHGVTLNDDPAVHAALFVTADDKGLRLSAFTVHHLGEVARHGFAWLSGDFRNGPHEDFGHVDEAVIRSTGEPTVSMLVDGEQAEAPSPLVFTREFSSLKFIRTKPPE